MENDTSVKLYTFAVSHFSEKIRWVLERSGIPYRDIQWTPFFHIVKALIKSKKATTVPIIEFGDIIVQDSTNIILLLEREWSGFRLLPKDPDQRQQVLIIEERADQLGKHIVRYFYGPLLENQSAFVSVWGWNSSPATKKILHLLFPMLKHMLVQSLNLSNEGRKESALKIEEMMAWLDEQVSDGRLYLVGDQLSIADISVASMLSPIVCPGEHPVYSSDAFTGSTGELNQIYKDRAGYQWVRKLYREHRIV